MNRVKFATMNALDKKDDTIIRVSDTAADFFIKKSNKAWTRKLNRLKKQVDQLQAEVDAYSLELEDTPINFSVTDEAMALLSDDEPDFMKPFTVDSNGEVTR